AHHDQADLPIVASDRKRVRVVVGSLYGERSPVPTLSETIFADALLEPSAVLPIDAATEERGLYIVSGEIDIAGDRFAAGQLLVFRPGDGVGEPGWGDPSFREIGACGTAPPRRACASLRRATLPLQGRVKSSQRCASRIFLAGAGSACSPTSIPHSREKLEGARNAGAPNAP